ncbi:MAG: AAA family ATPase [Halothiobacillaceae bacterium]|nr:AAA family ATPase [Halothiobacillaceae bacterium]
MLQDQQNTPFHKDLETPMSIWDYKENFKFDTPLDPCDELRVDLNKARGDYSRSRLLRELGFDVTDQKLRDAPSSKCILFGGHRGCGKSTELREIARELHGDQRFYVVQLDALKQLDINNLTYADVALSLAETLASRVSQDGISVDDIYLSPLRDWFKDVTQNTAFENELSSEIQAGAEADAGLPFIGKLFAKLTTSIKSNATYTTEIRNNVRNSFTKLAEAFNALLLAIEEKIKQKNKGLAVLFVIDGIDRLCGEDANNFFIRDFHQLRQLHANSIFCAPISLLNEDGQVSQNFDAVFRLPMVKLTEKGVAEPIQNALQIMREFVFKRLPQDNFDTSETLDSLIKHSGGHPRDLLRLITYCFQETDEGPITYDIAKQAMKRLSNDYRRLIQPDDYKLLVEIDRKGTDFAPVTEQSSRLLYDLALLEYNSYWWQSHPAVRSLDAYVTELRRTEAEQNASNANQNN